MRGERGAVDGRFSCEERGLAASTTYSGRLVRGDVDCLLRANDEVKVEAVVLRRHTVTRDNFAVTG